MGECNVSPENAAVLSTLSVNSGYWQVGVVEVIHYRTDITYLHGLYGFVRMSFDFKRALRSSQHAMNVMLFPSKW